MPGNDTAFAGSIPALYDRHLGPVLFQPYADEVALRAAAFRPKRILETAAGTGIVTAALAQACPEAEIVATDLNPAMLALAEQRIRSGNVIFQAADAQDLPFADEEFDMVVCQFGVMFYPDKVKGNSEARRVLRTDGRYLLAIWDKLSNNPAARIIHEEVAAAFPDNPPGFLGRTPYGYADPAVIEHDLLAAGFNDIEFETVELDSAPDANANDAAIGLVQGSPLRMEVEQHGDGALTRATQAALKGLEELNDPDRFDSPLSAHIVTAIR